MSQGWRLHSNVVYYYYRSDAMYRMIEENILKWKKQENHKPLLISGSRQVGKTYSILNFAKKHYLSYVYINFERDDDIRAFFEQTSKP